MTAEVSDRVTRVVSYVIATRNQQGLERARILSNGVAQLRELLDEDCMRSMMLLQNNKLGFKTDSENGYPESVVKSCLIEALLIGVQPCANHFNILSGGCYITKEGFGYLLSAVPELVFDIDPVSIKMSSDRTTAKVSIDVSWLKDGKEDRKLLELSVAADRGMKPDAIIGKALRKARKWLFEKITGFEIGDGEVSDLQIEFEGKPANEPTLEEVQALVREKLPSISAAELSSIQRIINRNETNSFSKIIDLLNSK